MEENEEVLLNSRQAAALLELSPDTVNEVARKNNVLPGVKRGRLWRFRDQDVTLFKKLQQKQVAA